MVQRWKAALPPRTKIPPASLGFASLSTTTHDVKVADERNTKTAPPVSARLFRKIESVTVTVDSWKVAPPPAWYS
jgi:hypothetical protein